MWTRRCAVFNVFDCVVVFWFDGLGYGCGVCGVVFEVLDWCGLVVRVCGLCFWF